MNFLLWLRNLLPDTTKPLSFNPETPAQNNNIKQNFTQKTNMRNEPEDMR